MGLSRLLVLAVMLGVASGAPWCNSIKSWSGAGLYCSGKWLLNCRAHNGAASSATNCRSGCVVASPGNPDFCKASPVAPPTGGQPTGSPRGSQPTGSSPPGQSSSTTLRCNNPAYFATGAQKNKAIANVCAPNNAGLKGECVSLISACVKREFNSNAGCSTNPWRKGVTGRQLRKGDVVATFLNSQTGALQEHYYGHVAVFDSWVGSCIQVWHQNWSSKRYVQKSKICKWDCLTCDPTKYYAVTVSTFNNGGKEATDSTEAEGEATHASILARNGGAPTLMVVGVVVALAVVAVAAVVIRRRSSAQTEEAEYTELDTVA